MEEQIMMVDWDAIRVSPFQPRRLFSDEELNELSASIQAVGLIHPPVVRAIKSGDKVLYYELIAGERRWRAAKLAGFKTLSVVVRSSDDAQAAKATLIENVQRVDLDPMELAAAFKRLIDIFRMTQEELSTKVGKKRSTIANYLRLLTLPTQMQQAISSGSITMGHAKAILSLDNSQLQENLHKLIVEQNLTVREAEKESQKLTRKKRKKDPHLIDLEEQLKERLNTKVSIDHTASGSGRVTVHYYNLDDLERLLSDVFVVEKREAVLCKDVEDFEK